MELLLVVVILGLLTTLAIPNFSRVRDRAMVARAIGDMRALQQEITEFRFRNGRLPATLDEVDRGGFLDPWDRPYQYLPIEGVRGVGGFRKDRFLVPLNSDYDLYSMGKDGATSGPLSAPASHDDIVRANDGGFVGLAEDF